MALVHAKATCRSQYPGMSFEEGVQAGIEWVLGLTDDLPILEPE